MSTPVNVKKTFREKGLTPKKWMGQNLLVDKLYLSKIVQAARVDPGESIVEIGAGLGVLTEALLARGAKVWALEVDSGFYRVLQEKFAGNPDVELVHADALKYDFKSLARKIGVLRVVANLPYNISSRLLFLFHEHRSLFASLHILLQKEVAERLVSDPGTKDYGVLTVLLGTSASIEILFDIPGKAFYPAPDVVSSFVKVEFPEHAPVPVQDLQLLNILTKASFTGRRKTLRNTLRNPALFGISMDEVIHAASDAAIDLNRRGETLSPSEFGRFADALVQRRERRAAGEK